MAFLPNHPKYGGKQAGTLNTRSKNFLAVLEKHNFCPASALIECYEEAKKTYDNYGTIYEAISEARREENNKDGSYPTPLEDNAHKYLKIAADIAKDLSSYAYPKLKSIEQSKSDTLKDMTPEQKLEAMKQAVAMLELKIYGTNSGFKEENS